MSQRLVALEDVLRALEQAGPLSSDAVASRLRLSRLDARLVLVDAHGHGLVRITGRGDWAITDRGLEALATELVVSGHHCDAEQEGWSLRPHFERLRTYGLGSRWRGVLHPRYLARRGLPLALGAIACAGGVAVASSGLGSSGPAPVIATTQVRTPAHGLRAQTPRARHPVATNVVATHPYRRSTPISTTGRIRHVRGRLLVQAPRRAVTGCAHRPGTHTASAGVTGVCASGRRTRLHPRSGGAGAGSAGRLPKNTGSGGSGGGSPAGS